MTDRSNITNKLPHKNMTEAERLKWLEALSRRSKARQKKSNFLDNELTKQFPEVTNVSK